MAHYYNVNKNKASVFLEMNIKYIMIAILVLGSLSYLKYSTFESFEPSPKPEEHKRAGHFLKTNVTEQYEKLNVMGKKPYVSFYSDSKYTMLPYAGSADVVHFAKLYNVDYIAIDERALSKWDYYGELMEMDKYSDEVELVYEDNTERLFKLFKVKK
ncbi:MAG: hypothetical protein HY758_01350 [Nitrospirae bacterium]|nr:hypothetical protein [Nitrospirota bacterium]